MEATNLPGPRIRGTFTKQMWVGPKADRAMNVGEEEFDATDAVLLIRCAANPVLQGGEG